MIYRIRPKKSVIKILFLVALIISGCATQAPTMTEQPQEVSEETPSPQIETTTAVPTPTSATSVVLFAAGPEADSFMVTQIQAALDGLIKDGEEMLVVDTGISPEQLTDNVAVVIGVGPDIDLAGLAAAAPQTHFVSIDYPGAVPSANLSVIGDPLVDRQHQSFSAGYLAALASSDYKVAALIPSDSDYSNVILDAFLIGVRFYCGICKPLYPPYENFPQYEMLSAENALDGFQAVIDALAIRGVEVLYLPGELHSPQILTYLADKDIKVVSDQSPDMTRNNWLGTVVVDPGPALVALWPDLAAGAEGMRKSSSLTLIDLETGLLSAGRQRVFDQMLVDLQAGLVLPQSVP